jgi:hypothetical protein
MIISRNIILFGMAFLVQIIAGRYTSHFRLLKVPRGVGLLVAGDYRLGESAVLFRYPPEALTFYPSEIHTTFNC